VGRRHRKIWCGETPFRKTWQHTLCWKTAQRSTSLVPESRPGLRFFLSLATLPSPPRRRKPDPAVDDVFLRIHCFPPTTHENAAPPPRQPCCSPLGETPWKTLSHNRFFCASEPTCRMSRGMDIGFQNLHPGTKGRVFFGALRQKNSPNGNKRAGFSAVKLSDASKRTFPHSSAKARNIKPNTTGALVHRLGER